MANQEYLARSAQNLEEIPMLSELQKRIYEYIKNYIISQGKAPSLREIQHEMGIRSVSNVEYHLKKLEESSLIFRELGASRSIVLVGDVPLESENEDGQSPQKSSDIVKDQRYTYDVVLSYAGEDREKAEALVTALQRRGVKVFYDQNEKAAIWGKNLYTYLSDIYKNKARYCLMLLSYHYATKRWTKHELKSAQARAFIKEHEDYILPIRIDDTEIPGILETTAYLDWHTETVETIADAILAKLDKLPPSSEEILGMISTLTSSMVLILGRYTPERKVVLDAVKNELSKYNYTPILFDFEKPSSRTFTEIIRTLAHLARFIIADLTDPASIPLELQAIVPILAVPVQPILLAGQKEYSMFEDLRKHYPWVLPTFLYQDTADLLASLKEYIINPAEQKAQEIAKP